MRITPDGQITIPPEIREVLNISPDVELAFEIEDDRLYLKKIRLPIKFQLGLTPYGVALLETSPLTKS
ncbi:AbrB/MazE/SpoVT family DNA-binding domain-containing protein [Nostoc sp. ChiVER01]|uniref:AbrB/MazE/SpoVT family DNA-binding domain-containing protein n=1 Tax=Nostoc sp. ChiVER01 TaxID=3075382 RepID=UPI002AD5269A|nr:AbrB/MazE/SpoVT family DNA-binding domain-containing protein [Nostoc sp. ChiVER01]MDZ8222744.1 AbrB/MazE/SpoVT family DNA-binding domain-containing protein [Nostoc sp. ChiVER01]